MERTRKTDWLVAQGYRLSTIPPVVTWYVTDKSTGKERELRGRTDDYTLNLYRSKGYVLDRKYLDPQLWHDLEYGTTRPSKTVEPPQPPRSTPRLASAMRKTMSGRDFWEGTASELLSMIPLGKVGIPKDSTRLAAEVMKPHIADALKLYGLTVHRRRTGGRRLLQLRSGVVP